MDFLDVAIQFYRRQPSRHPRDSVYKGRLSQKFSLTRFPRKARSALAHHVRISLDPKLIACEGSSSTYACKLYNTGVQTHLMTFSQLAVHSHNLGRRLLWSYIGRLRNTARRRSHTQLHPALCGHRSVCKHICKHPASIL